MNGATMTASHQKPETIARGARMLRTALGPSIARFLEDPGVIEVMLNPDGRIWIDRLSEGLADTGEMLSAADGERIVRLVAHHVGAEVHARAPRVSAELPETGERFEGLLPPVVAAPAFAIRKPAVAVFTLDDYVTAGIMSAEISSKLDVRPATGSSSDTVVALRLSDRALVASLLEAIVAKIDQTVGQDFLAKQRQSVVQRLEEIQESIATYKRAIARLDASLVQLERQTNSDLSVYPTTTNTLVGLMKNLSKLNDIQRTLLQQMEEIPSSIVKERVSQPRLIGPSSTRIALAIAVVTSLGLLIFVFARAGLRMVVTTSAGLTKVNRIRRAFWLPPRPASSDGG